MGQYYYVVNVTKKQYLHPHDFGDGLKLMEFGASGDGTMMGLAALLADGNGRGGGDVRSKNQIIGSWAGDQIVIAGDYADNERFTGDPNRNLYQLAQAEYENISKKVIRAMVDSKHVAETLREKRYFGCGSHQNVYDNAISDDLSLTGD
jgi:hypothetical protein